MNRFTTIIACALALTALSGCSKEKYSGQDDAKMHFVPSLPGTKASDTAFEAGDSFGIYAVEYYNLVPAPLQLSGNWANNAEASFDGSVWTVAPEIWWKDDAAFDVIAYYPYDREPGSVDDYIFEVRGDQSADGFTLSDLMWAKAEGVERSGGDVVLNFRHKLSRLDINLVKGEDYEGELPKTAEVRIMNTVTTASMDLERGEIEKNPYGKEGTIKAHPNGVGSYSAIVVPQMLLNQVPLVEILVNDVSYIVSSKFIFESGVRHTMNVTLSSDPNKVVINIGGGISAWN